jgi:hypothetical protein
MSADTRSARSTTSCAAPTSLSDLRLAALGSGDHALDDVAHADRAHRLPERLARVGVGGSEDPSPLADDGNVRRHPASQVVHGAGEPRRPAVERLRRQGVEPRLRGLRLLAQRRHRVMAEEGVERDQQGERGDGERQGAHAQQRHGQPSAESDEPVHDSCRR